jgi:2,4-dienoyl-CoA reductase-like NADH-dependent reductase (Old Yellow Enzyme family)
MDGKQINKRTDAYGGTPEKRALIVTQIIDRVRQATGPEFCIGIKLNSTDYQHDGAEGVETLRSQVKTIASTSVDFIEVSGGTFEDPEVSVHFRRRIQPRLTKR